MSVESELHKVFDLRDTSIDLIRSVTKEVESSTVQYGV